MTAAGSGGAQAIGLLALPFIARWYGPEPVATWALIQGATGLLGCIATLRLENAIPLPRGARAASSVFWVATLATFAVASAAAALQVAPVARAAIGLPPSTSAAEACTIVGASTLLQGVLATCSGWAVRHAAFRIASASQVALAAVGASFQLAWPSFGEATFRGLVWGTVVGQAAGVVVFAVGWLRFARLRPAPTTCPRMWTALRSNRRFPAYSIPLSLFGTARDRANVLVLEGAASSAAIGAVAIVQRVTNVPASLASSVLRPVVFAHAARDGIRAVEPKLLAIFKLLLLAGAPCLVATSIHAEWISSTILGPGWPESPSLLRLLVWPSFAFIFSNWLDRLLDLQGRQRLALALEVVFSIGALTALGGGLASGWTVAQAIAAFAAVTTAYHVIYIVAVFRACGFRLAALKEPALRFTVVVSAPLIAASLELGAPATAALVGLAGLLWFHGIRSVPAHLRTLRA